MSFVLIFKRKMLLFFGTVIFLLSACMSVPTNKAAPSGPAAPPAGELFRCGQHWVAYSQGNTLVVIGVANRHLRRDSEIAAAKYDAAHRIAMFYGMNGAIESLLRMDGGVLGFATDSRITLEPIFDNQQFIDQLQFNPDRDVFVIDGGTLVYFRYETRITPVNFAVTTDAGGRPNWVDGRVLPEVAGYVAAVGFAQNQLRLQDTVMMSTRSVAARIIEYRSTRVQNEVIQTGIGTATYTRTRSEGSLSNFRILEFWINPENGHVHTLGIARFIN